MYIISSRMCISSSSSSTNFSHSGQASSSQPCVASYPLHGRTQPLLWCSECSPSECVEREAVTARCTQGLIRSTWSVQIWNIHCIHWKMFYRQVTNLCRRYRHQRITSRYLHIIRGSFWAVALTCCCQKMCWNELGGRSSRNFAESAVIATRSLWVCSSITTSALSVAVAIFFWSLSCCLDRNLYWWRTFLTRDTRSGSGLYLIT